MTLEDKREQWEKGGEVVLTVTDKEVFKNGSSYPTVYVVLNFKDEYSLHRYFPIWRKIMPMKPDLEDSIWEVSVDVSNSTIEKCLEEVSNAFEKRYPKDA
jgi:hypothetical protein